MKRYATSRTAAGLALALGLTTGVHAQTAAPLTLEEALRRASEHSESVDIARAGETRASAEVQRVASQRFPQVSFTGSYSRTLASEFSSAFDSAGPVCDPFFVDPTRPLADRVAEIERAASCGSLTGGGGFDLENLPFGQRNIYQLGLAFSQALYAGGRISAQGRQADVALENANITTTLTETQLALDVTRAFFDAALADRLVAIAESVYDQAAAAYEQTSLAFNAGRQPEFELLRAQVARDNQRPTVIRRRADRDIAYVRLRQLLELPADAPLQLAVDLENPALPPPVPFAEALAAASAAAAETPLSVRQSDALVTIREAGLVVARAERLPAVNLTSSLAGVGYPSNGAFPTPGDFRANWSVGAAVQIPIFTGGRLRAGERSAQADLTEAEARRDQTRKMADLDRTTALQDLAAAEALWEASAGTVQQAERAYQIAELRNREGLSTQLELSDSRVSLEVAQANRAQAARDVQVARARVALLPNLPAGAR
jgi:outer membrane protein TolC